MSTVVHLLRHGEVHNPDGVLYGRLPGFSLSEAGRRMAQAAAEDLRGDGVVLVRSSPLERARETAQAVADVTGSTVQVDERLVESGNVLQGTVPDFAHLLRRLPVLRNPFRPSWGEPYTDVVARMRAAVEDARVQAAGHAAVLVSHQLPIWVTRRSYEGRRLWHSPRSRECALASLTSLHFDGERLVEVVYREPAGAAGRTRATGA